MNINQDLRKTSILFEDQGAPDASSGVYSSVHEHANSECNADIQQKTTFCVSPVSVFNLFSIGIGPSSSHTVGPMKAARDFVLQLEQQQLLKQVVNITIDLYGSLALTGEGHGTDKAILNGLEGKEPHTVDPDKMVPRMEMIFKEKQLRLLDQYPISFSKEKHFLLHQKEFLPKHSNGMRFSAFDKHNNLLLNQIYYSIGGGFIVTDESFGIDHPVQTLQQPYPFTTAAELFNHCHKHHLTVEQLMLENEKIWRSESEIRQTLLCIASTMENCIHKGCQTHGTLPGMLKVKRRAAELFKKLTEEGKGIPSIYESSDIMNWLNVYAMAVNEENAAGGRVVTAPTNGAAGIIPAVLEYLKNFHQRTTNVLSNKDAQIEQENKIITFLMTAGAIAILYKKGASISGAEVGCQGEVGVASSMAAGGLAAALGGTLTQIENAAEIAMEHHLGMTCDPVAGLVQIPCIERNAMGAVKAVNAARLALMEDGKNSKVSLDMVIATMRQTGKDMMTIYKETSLGGLAVNVPEC